MSGVLALAVTTSGCGRESPSAPSTTSAPVPLTLTAISPTKGVVADVVKISGTGFLGIATVTLDRVSAKVTGVSSTLITAIAPIHAAGTVDVVVTNPGGQSATLTGGYTYELVSLTVSPDVVTAGGQLTVSWVAPSGRSSGDWVSLFRVGDPDASHGWAEHTDDAPTGRFTLSAPAQPGQYEFRYMVGENAAAHSSPVTIIASGA